MTGIVLRNARVVSDGRITEGDLLVVGDRVVGVGRVSPPAGLPDRDLAGVMVLPGLIDLQVNGLGGMEVHGADAAALNTITRAAACLGCTSLLFTLISTEPGGFSRLAAGLEATAVAGARVLGVHVEGPFINPAHPGAHPPDALRVPSRAETADALSLLGRRVRLWTLAPELPGAGEVIQLLREAGVVVAAGHSGLDYEGACRWFGRGVSMVTHLFNAMTGLQHRRPGLAAAALLDHRVRFSIIADGHHAHPAMVRLAQRLGGDRLILVTDAAAPAGAPDGTYTVGGRPVSAKGGVVRLADGTLAGSALGALQAVDNYADFTGLSIAEASVAMTSRPADLLGEWDLGRLGEGALADFLILDEQGNLAETWIRGMPEYAHAVGEQDR